MLFELYHFKSYYGNSIFVAIPLFSSLKKTETAARLSRGSIRNSMGMSLDCGTSVWWGLGTLAMFLQQGAK